MVRLVVGLLLGARRRAWASSGGAPARRRGARPPRARRGAPSGEDGYALTPKGRRVLRWRPALEQEAKPRQTTRGRMTSTDRLRIMGAREPPSPNGTPSWTPPSPPPSNRGAVGGGHHPPGPAAAGGGLGRVLHRAAPLPHRRRPLLRPRAHRAGRPRLPPGQRLAPPVATVARGGRCWWRPANESHFHACWWSVGDVSDPPPAEAPPKLVRPAGNL